MKSATKYSPPDQIMVFFSPDELRAIADRFEKEMPHTLVGGILPRETLYGDGFTVDIIMDQDWWHKRARKKAL